MADLPPTYEAATSMPFEPSSRGSSGNIQRQFQPLSGSISSLVDQLTLLQTSVRLQQPQITTLETIVKDKQQQLKQRLEDWYNFADHIIKEQYQKKLDEINSRADCELQHLSEIKDTCCSVISDTDQICEQALSVVDTGDESTIDATKRKVEEQIKQLKHCSNGIRTHADQWCFRRPDVLQLNGIMGSLNFGRPTEPVGETENVLATTSTQASAPAMTGAAGDFLGEWEHSASAGLRTPGINEAIRRLEQMWAGHGENMLPERNLPNVPRALPSYRLMYSFQTNTSRDKARSHPMTCVIGSMSPNDLEVFVVPDKLNSKVKIFSFIGELVLEIKHSQMIAPVSVASTLYGDLVVGDIGAKDIKLFNLDGTLVEIFRVGLAPLSMAVNSVGNVIIGDSEKNEIYSLDLTTGCVNFLISRQGPEYFASPNYLAVTPTDDILVGDTSKNSIYFYNKDGIFRKKFGPINKPHGMVVNSDGLLLTADFENHCIKVIDPYGRVPDSVVQTETQLKYATSVALTSTKKMIVTEYLSGLVKIFQEEGDQMEARERPPDCESEYALPSAPPDSA